jgi:hypothetical protein
MKTEDVEEDEGEVEGGSSVWEVMAIMATAPRLSVKKRTRRQGDGWEEEEGGSWPCAVLSASSSEEEEEEEAREEV